jgi:hypothetical protein
MDRSESQRAFGVVDDDLRPALAETSLSDRRAVTACASTSRFSP